MAYGIVQVNATFGQSMVVNITRASGGVPVAYTDATLATPIALPATISSTTQFFMVAPESYVISVKVNGQESATSQGTTLTSLLPENDVLVLAPSPSLSAEVTANSGTYVAHVADATGVAATDSAAIQAAITALPATGGEVRLGKGTYLLGSTTITVSKPARIVGAGALNTLDGGATPSARTLIQFSAATGDAFTVSANGCVFEDLAVVNTAGSTPTAGAGIHFTLGNLARLSRVGIVGFWNNLQVDVGSYWTATDCHFFDPVNYGAYVRNTAHTDNGDFGFTQCVFTSYYKTYNAAAAVRWESGGGMRFVGNKINGQQQPGNVSAGSFVLGLDIAVADGVGTSDFNITGNSIEACTAHSIKVSNSSTGTINYVQIIGNQFLTSGVWCSANASGNFQAFMVEGNIFGNMTAAFSDIYMKNVAGLTIGPNHHHQPAGGQACLTLDTGCTYADVVPQNLEGSGYWVVDNNATASVGQGTVKHEYTRELSGVNSNSTYTNQISLALPIYCGGMIEIAIHGNGAGQGGFGAVLRRVYARQLGACVLSTVGTDTWANPGANNVLDVQVDGSSGNINIGVRLNPTANPSSVVGKIVVRVDGILTNAQKT